MSIASPATLRRLVAVVALGALAGCGAPQVERVAFAPEPELSPRTMAMYGRMQDGDFIVPAIPARYLSQENRRQIVDYWTDEPVGSIVVDPYDRFLYYVLEGDRAIRYRVGVGEAGRNFSGRATIPHKREWPRWTPTANMLREDPDLYEPHRHGMEGGLENPLGARALYLYRGGRDTLYRIHGTYAPWSIGVAVSAGCIRMFNQDVIDLYERVDPGTRVLVLAEHQRGQGTVPPGTAPIAAAAFPAEPPG